VIAIEAADGIGNIIQSVPFIIEMKRKHKELILYDRADSSQAFLLIKKHFVSYVKHPARLKVPLFRIPPLNRYIGTPEYKIWFKHYNVDMPKVFRNDLDFEENTADYDYVVWPGCKPNWLMKMYGHWEELVSQLNGSVAVVGLKDDGPKNIPGAIDYRGKFSLLQTGGIIKNCKVFIGNEGGISHYSAALGVKTLILWGGSDHVKNFPGYLPNVESIMVGLDCQPCQHVKCYAKDGKKYGCAPKDYIDGTARCLYRLDPKTIIDKLNRI
jgi:hypothetical protein